MIRIVGIILMVIGGGSFIYYLNFDTSVSVGIPSSINQLYQSYGVSSDIIDHMSSRRVHNLQLANYKNNMLMASAFVTLSGLMLFIAGYIKGQKSKTKVCPDCAEPVALQAKICKYCKYTFKEEGIKKECSLCERYFDSSKISDNICVYCLNKI